MPNWCWNNLTITTQTPKQFEKLVQGIAGDSTQPFDFNRVIPEPKELLEVESPNKSNPDEMTKKYGFPSWYEWRTANWGTKWNAGECDLTIDSPTSLRVSFNTAWSPPIPIIETLSAKFPFADIAFSYEGEDGYWGFMSFTKGELVEERQGDMDCEYRIREWGECVPDCEECGICDCECGCDDRTTQTICHSCNKNKHQNKNNLPEFTTKEIGVSV